MIIFAYFDPGSGGYLFSAVLAWVGGGLALGAALAIHFFKRTFKTGAAVVGRHRPFFFVVLPTAALVIAVLFWTWHSRQLSSYGGLVEVPFVADAAP